MKIVSWNVNGIRAILKKDFTKSLNGLNADIICLQETKAQDQEVLKALESQSSYHIYVNSAEQKGYSGTAILSKVKPIQVCYGMGVEEHDKEGRVICAEYDNFYLVNVYVPNSGRELIRLDYRQRWDADFLNFLQHLNRRKPVIACGDFNVAHSPIDLKNDKTNYNKTAGYTQIEIDGMDNFINNGFIDSYRILYPDTVMYTYWSYRFNSRAKNVGWRIDYFLIHNRFTNHIKDIKIHTDIMGSDHCPLSMELNI